MIVCHCNVIGSRDIEEVVLTLVARDPHRVITPGTVFAGCGKRPNCGGCMPLVVAALADARVRCTVQARVRTTISDPDGVASLVGTVTESADSKPDQSDTPAVIESTPILKAMGARDR